VGDPALVTTIDFDSSLIEPARRRLAAVGCDAIEVIDGDGDDGVPSRAPFDRIVATCGCNDLSPAWFEQLAPDGQMLVPVHHGAGHPLVRARPDRTSEIVGPSGFVKVQGRQDQPTWWERTRLWLPDRVQWTASPHQGLDLYRAWDAAFYVALRDRRGGGGLGPSIGEGESMAMLDVTQGIGQHGPEGEALAEGLGELLDDWVAIGSPSMSAFTATWEPRAEVDPVDAISGPWRIPRVHHTETVVLSRPA
jgi:hypothetical protein